jgi:hypothetical protein
MNDIYPNFPEIIDLLDKKADLGAVSIYSLRETPIQTSLFDFLKLSEKSLFIDEICNYEKPLKSEWEHTEKTDSIVFQGIFSGFLDASNEYGLTYRGKPSPLFLDSDRTLFMSVDVLNPELSPECRIAVSIDIPGKNKYYRELPLNILSSSKSSWKKTETLFIIPKLSVPNSTLTVYFWNKGRNKMYIDNMEVKVY